MASILLCSRRPLVASHTTATTCVTSPPWPPSPPSPVTGEQISSKYRSPAAKVNFLLRVRALSPPPVCEKIDCAC